MSDPQKLSDQELMALLQKGLAADMQQGAAAPEGAGASDVLGVAKGVLQPWNRGAELLESGINKAGRVLGYEQAAAYLNRMGSRLGMAPSVADAKLSQADKIVDAAQEMGNPSARGEFAGNLIGTLPLAPLGPVAGGAASGALLGDGQGQFGLPGDIVMGGVGGKVGDVALKGLATTIAPKVSEAARNLLNEGVALTPGQIIGGEAKRMEDAVASIPYVGGFVADAQHYANETLNRAAVNRALGKIGDALPKTVETGYNAIRYAQDKISEAYDRVLPGISVKADQPFVQGVSTLYQMAQALPKASAETFDRVFKNDIMPRFTQAGLLTGNGLKEVERKMGDYIRSYGRSPDPDHGQLANAFRELLDEVREMVARQVPDKAAELRNINAASANLMRVENAAARTSAEGGVFKPATLDMATAAMDTTARRRSTAANKALMQDLATDARNVMGNKVPDSGTPYRAMLAAGLLSGGGGAASTAVGLGPGAAALGAVPLMYSRYAVEKAIPLVLRERPAAVRQLAQALTKAKAPAVVAGARTAVKPRQPGSEE